MRRSGPARAICFDQFGEDAQVYGSSPVPIAPNRAARPLSASSFELQRRAMDYGRRDDGSADDEFFSAEQTPEW